MQTLQQPWPWYVAGILIGLMVPTLLLLGNIHFGISANEYLLNTNEVVVNPALLQELYGYGITDTHHMLPAEIFSWESLLTLRGFIMLLAGGFLVGFGTRYAGGCTSGHAIMGLSNLQWPSLVATICFMLGGYIMANVFLPLILKL